MTDGLNALHRLATYGSLAPDRPGHHHLAGVHGRWMSGEAHGHLLEEGWGAALGYPALLLAPDGPPVGVQVLESAHLPAHWARLDDFEGSGYERVLPTVHTADDDVDAYSYGHRSGGTV